MRKVTCKDTQQRMAMRVDIVFTLDDLMFALNDCYLKESGMLLEDHTEVQACFVIWRVTKKAVMTYLKEHAVELPRKILDCGMWNELSEKTLRNLSDKVKRMFPCYGAEEGDVHVS